LLLLSPLQAQQVRLLGFALLLQLKLLQLYLLLLQLQLLQPALLLLLVQAAGNVGRQGYDQLGPLLLLLLLLRVAVELLLLLLLQHLLSLHHLSGALECQPLGLLISQS
jgi:hypothetical protein